jgi:UDP-N-acetylglucosamine 1-carboxyvinyltransferase
MRFLVRGGNPLAGRIVASGNKNAALPLLAASLLTDQPVTFANVPRVDDVLVMIEVLASLGVGVSWDAEHQVTLCAAHVDPDALDRALARRIRGSLLLAGPLLARCGRAALPPPGGDVIGRRRIDTHVLGLQGLGATFEVRDGYAFSARQLIGGEVFLDEPSVTATENILMAAARARGPTTLINAASEPHVQDLCYLLTAMGCEISGVGTNVLCIRGADSLSGARVTVGPDTIEVGSLIACAALTGGTLDIAGARARDLRATANAFARIGIRFQLHGDVVHVPAEQSLCVGTDVGGAIPKIEDAPWPGFPADLTSIAVVAATQAQGTVLVHEKLFESRLFFTDRLAAMGARLILCDPHRVVVTGRSPLVAQELSSPDIRAGMALLIATLCAKGQSVIHNIGQIDRGYENIAGRLRALGADIERV